LRFIPHEKIKEYIACYRVIYNRKEIYPPAAVRLGIPLGEILLSDAFKNFADCILFHELQEIKHRAEGYCVDEAHLLALKDEERECKNNEKWKKLKKEINVCTKESLLSTPGIGETLAERIMENRPYDRMEELKRVRGIGEKRFGALKNNFWCILDK
jgi:competence protein ComEA